MAKLRRNLEITLLVLLILLTSLSLIGCNTTTVRSTSVTPTYVPPEPIPEHLLLDVGIDLFDPRLDTIDEASGTSSPGVRYAEAIFFAEKLAEAVQATNTWGAVRVVPKKQSETDVYVSGEILKSDGDSLHLTVTVADASGKKWYTRTYQEEASQYAYDNVVRQQRGEPFGNIYRQIANDMVGQLSQLSHTELEELRTVTKLRFAQRFAPDAFDEYMAADSNGRFKILRLPAQNDPYVNRIDQIRVRDQMFVDRLQDHYGGYADQIEEPYNQWRQESQRENRQLKQLKSEATAKKIGGALAVLAGILAQGSSSSISRSAGVVGIGAGAYLFKDGLDKGQEAKIHAEALKELSQSLSSQLEPLTVNVANETVTLTGTVEEQYAQWREILREIYLAEVGLSLPEQAANSEPSTVTAPYTDQGVSTP